MSESHDVTIIAGLSGAGKSYLINALLQKNENYIHFSAGSLIKKRLSHVDRDKLRELHGDSILANQYLMVEQFTEDLCAFSTSASVVFDAHMLIDGEHGITEIPLEIFERLSPNRIVFILEDAATIMARRKHDASRHRPNRTIAELTSQQDRSIKLATEYALELGIPLLTIQSGDAEGLRKAVYAA